MSKKILLILLIIVVGVSASGCYLFWTKYKNPKLKFSINLPRGWTVQENVEGAAVIAYLPKTKIRGKYRENISVIASKIPEGEELFLEDFFDLNKQITMSVLPGSKLDQQEGEIYAGKHKGLFMLFSNKTESVYITIYSAAWIEYGRIYVVTCTAGARDFKKYKKMYDKVMRSLRIEKD